MGYDRRSTRKFLGLLALASACTLDEESQLGESDGANATVEDGGLTTTGDSSLTRGTAGWTDVTSPATGGVTPPATGGVMPPATGGVTPPATGGVMPPATGGTQLPSTASATTTDGGVLSNSGEPCQQEAAMGGDQNVTITGSGNTVYAGHPCQQLYGSGKLVSEARDVEAFTGLRIGESLTVELSRGDRNVVLSMDDNLLSRVATSVQNGVLVIANSDPNVSLVPSPDARIFVANPSLSLISSEGAATVSGETGGPSLTLTASGSSLLTLNLSVEGALRASASGASTLHMEGNAASLVATASGAAILDSEVPVTAAEITASGSARVSVVATESVVVHAAGAAVVTVHGAPTQRVFEATGAASVIFSN